MTRRSKLVLGEFLPYRLSMASNLVSDTGRIQGTQRSRNRALKEEKY